MDEYETNMKNPERWTVFIALAILFLGCGEHESVTPQPDHGGMLSHSVFFDLKPDADVEAFLSVLRQLERIPVVKDMQLGTFEDLKDPRALDTYEVAMEIICLKEDYPVYQAHEIHDKVRQQVGEYLSNKPAVFDYMVK